MAILGWAAGGEEVDEQLCDALGLVVDPVRGVGQALDAVEIGHIVAVGLGQVGGRDSDPAAPRSPVGAAIRRSCASARFGDCRTAAR